MISQVDLAIKTILSSVSVNGSTVPVILDGGSKFSESVPWPVIGISLLGTSRQKIRETQQPTTEVDPGVSIQYRPPAECFDLMYQVEFYANYPADDRSLIEQINDILEAGYIVALNPRDGLQENLTMRVENPMNMNETDRDKDTVIFRKVWTVIIETFWDEAANTTVPDIAVGVTVNSDNI